MGNIGLALDEPLKENGVFCVVVCIYRDLGIDGNRNCFIVKIPFDMVAPPA